MDMRRVFSSHVEAIGYDTQSREFHVEYKNGKTSVYMDVPPQVAQLIQSAPSIGEAIHANLRGQFAHGYKAS